ncbi:Na+/H+ antiporter NhaC family protein [Oceanimonas baumannii]|uniref:Na+/H+ antiporter NhaC family protein n=1 Tax=Oceanimonas baumannii TaxID=129578 RepID=UPI001D17D7D5|nr:Na+/H+ antiporter NhaC family protein [Oceanimonas baumannii]MCC4265246.1 Na+/H+ antiporter NhaC family protein [Oceanimonas baumannii]
MEGCNFRRWLMPLLALILLLPGLARASDLTLEAPPLVLKGIPFEVTVSGVSDQPLWLVQGEERLPVMLNDGEAIIELVTGADSLALSLQDEAGTVLAEAGSPAIAAWLSVVPAMLAIVLALAFRQVILALFVAICCGGWLGYGLAGDKLLNSVLDSVNVHVLAAASDSEHMSVVLFCLLIGGMVGIISRNGGTVGIARHITRFVRGRRSAQTTTGLLGTAIFFDDYANALIVGNTMRNITDRLRISREKLAYLVDSTAAPVSAILLVTTWIGFQVGLIDEALRLVDGFEGSAYGVFMASISYSFYPILALVFVFMISLSGRDFGPMLKAEQRAVRQQLEADDELTDREAIAEEASIDAKPGIPHRALNAIIPMTVLVFTTLGGIWYTGMSELGFPAEAGLRDVFGNSDSFTAMMWGSLLSTLVALVMTRIQGLLSMDEAAHYWFEGVKSMLLPITILMMAWALSSVNETLNTSDYLVSVLSDSLQPELIPVSVFMLSAFTAFATGSSWGVMGIMMPLVVPLAWAVLQHHGLAGDPQAMHLFYASVAAVLAGAVWGDHCSPLAETTLLAAMASGCGLVEHVRTQLPYALFVGVIATLFGVVPVAYGMPWWLGILICSLAMAAGLRLLGKRADAEDCVPTTVGTVDAAKTPS